MRSLGSKAVFSQHKMTWKSKEKHVDFFFFFEVVGGLNEFTHRAAACMDSISCHSQRRKHKGFLITLHRCVAQEGGGEEMRFQAVSSQSSNWSQRLFFLVCHIVNLEDIVPNLTREKQKNLKWITFLMSIKELWTYENQNWRNSKEAI